VVAPLRAVLPPSTEAVCSPALRARQTAAAAGLDPRTDARLAECDFGSWAGRLISDVHGADAAGLARWMTDPDARPHGGETLTELSRRVGSWLDERAGAEPQCLIAVTHGGVIKVAVARVLRAPLRACWQIDVEPLSITELQVHDGGAWMVKRVNCPIEPLR